MYKVIITSRPDTLNEYLQKVIAHRSMLTAFAWRDLKIKYAQTLIGLGWTIIQPVTALIVYTLFFDYLLDMPASYSPYVLYVFSGLSCWALFHYIFVQGSTALMQNRDLLKKLIFPKMLLPLSKIIVALVEFSIALILLVGMLIYFNVLPGWRVLLMVLPVFGIILTGFSMALLMCAATITYRDLHHLVPFFINFGIWFTPVFYPLTLIPPTYVKFLYLNPLTSYLEIFRWCMGIQSNLHSHYYFVSVFVTLIMFGISCVFFIKMEDKIAEMV